MNEELPAISLPGEIEAGKCECAVIHDSIERGRISLFRKPPTPDPFVNAQMTSVGPDDKGRERFFISCLSGHQGATSFLITEDGECATYKWKDLVYVYGVAQESTDILWLAGGSPLEFIRLSLSSGQWEKFPVEGGRFITAGMALDPDTGKLFCGAQTALVSFDTRNRKTIRAYGEAEKPPDNFHYDHWRLPDGSYGFILETPGLSYLRWDPKTEQVRWRRLTDDSHHPAIGLVRWLKYEEEGRIYLPHFGWLDGITGEIVPHAHPPEQEACWLRRRGDTAYGVQCDVVNVIARLIAWDLSNGKTRQLFSVPDTLPSSCALTRNGKVALVDLYGTFQRYDAATGALEVTRSVESYNEHRCNVILPTDGDRMVGTPFISQNFWVFDTRKGKGFYAGRVGGSAGQCDYALDVGGKIYFAIYGGGQLTEYDPQKPAGFPRNPHVVARNDQGQHGAGITTDGRVVWTAFKAKYGTLDGAMIRYDTATGEATYRNGAVSGQSILTPIYDTETGYIVAGTTYLADCSTATPIHDRVLAVILEPRAMGVIRQTECPAGVDALVNHGPLAANRWLMQGGNRLFVFDTTQGTISSFEKRPTVPDKTVNLAYAGISGRFLIQVGESLQLWNAGADTFNPIAFLPDGFAGRWWVHDADVTFDCGRYAALWRGCLSSIQADPTNSEQNNSTLD